MKEIGGVQELAKALGVDLDLGIQTTPEGQERFTLEDRIDVFGINTMKHVTRTTPFPWTNALLKRQILTPLIVAAMVLYKITRSLVFNGLFVWLDKHHSRIVV